MDFKDPSVEKEFLEQIPVFLRFIVQDAANYALQKYNKNFTVTRCLEFIKGDSGVHEHHRGVDVRDEHDGVHVFMPDEIAAILTYVNTKYPRNDKFQTLIHHSFGGGPFHLHFQLAESTITYIPKGDQNDRPASNPSPSGNTNGTEPSGSGTDSSS